MNFAYILYLTLSSVIFAVIFPFLLIYSFLGKNKDFKQRLGIYPNILIKKPAGSPRIWFHAASVGEVAAASTIIEKIKSRIPFCSIILSVNTLKGKEAAVKIDSIDASIYAPIDSICPLKKAISSFVPDIFVFVETEIWPNWLKIASIMEIKTVFVNGRISNRSVKKYLKFNRLIKHALKNVDVFSMIHQKDANRLLKIGAQSSKILINGNAKFDYSLKTKNQEIFNIEKRPVFIAGSTRSGEEEILISAFIKVIEKFPDTLMIIAPRHIERCLSIKKMSESYGLSCMLKTKIKGKKDNVSVIVLDTMGELKDIYSIADVVFCGGSLVDKGGQNIIEPAAIGKPILHGPFMEDFFEAVNLLAKEKGAVKVKNALEIAENIIYLLSYPEKAYIMGENARRAVKSNIGASAKHADIILKALQKKRN